MADTTAAATPAAPAAPAVPAVPSVAQTTVAAGTPATSPATAKPTAATTATGAAMVRGWATPYATPFQQTQTQQQYAQYYANQYYNYNYYNYPGYGGWYGNAQGAATPTANATTATTTPTTTGTPTSTSTPEATTGDPAKPAAKPAAAGAMTTTPPPYGFPNMPYGYPGMPYNPYYGWRGPMPGAMGMTGYRGAMGAMTPMGAWQGGMAPKQPATTVPMEVPKVNSTSIHDYVQRCHKVVTDLKYRPHTESIIAQKIQAVIKSGKMNELDWDNEPVPQLIQDLATSLQNGTPLPEGYDWTVDPQAEAAARKRKKQEEMEAEFMAFARSEDDGKRRARNDRFADYIKSTQQSTPRPFDPFFTYKPFIIGEAIDLDKIPPCEGRSEVLEKDYLRLTTAPDPATIRPEHILRKSLVHILEKSKEKNDPYHYLCHQLKSIRQDLTVQRINNLFTVEVYETAARLALQYGDSPEFNQCQANLKTLYQQGFVSSPRVVAEFRAYRLIYTALTEAQDELNRELEEVTPEDLASEEVQHAMQAVHAWVNYNYVKFNKLYLKAPNMGRECVNLFRRQICDRIYPRLLKPYRPTTVPISFVKQTLFPGDDPVQDDVWSEFAARVQLVLVNGNPQELDSKQSFASFQRMIEEISHNPGFA